MLLNSKKIHHNGAQDILWEEFSHLLTSRVQAIVNKGGHIEWSVLHDRIQIFLEASGEDGFQNPIHRLC